MSRPVIRFTAAAVLGFVVSLLLNTYVVVALIAGLATAVVLGAVIGWPGRWAAIFADLRTVADRTKLVAQLQADLTLHATTQARVLTEQGSAVRPRLRSEGIASPLLEQQLTELVETGLAGFTTLTQDAAGMLHQVAAVSRAGQRS